MPDAAATGSALAGLRLLLVEDEMILAMSLGDLLERLGCTIIKAPSVDQAQTRVANEKLDGALLDINIRGAHVYPVASDLADRDIPFVFMTGYDRSAIEDPWSDRPVVRKPFTLESLEEAAASAFGNRPPPS